MPEQPPEHCCRCIPGRACVVCFVTCVRPCPSTALSKHGDPVFPHHLVIFGTIAFAVPVQWRTWYVALCRLQQGSIWVAMCGCSINAMRSCVPGCTMACCFVLSCFEGSGWLVSATCVPWDMAPGNAGLSKHGDPVCLHFCPSGPEPGPCYHKGWGGGELRQAEAAVGLSAADVHLWLYPVAYACATAVHAGVRCQPLWHTPPSPCSTRWQRPC